MCCQLIVKSALTESKGAAKRRRIYHVSITSAFFRRHISLCDMPSSLSISLKTNWRKRVLVEFTQKRNFNNMHDHG